MGPLPLSGTGDPFKTNLVIDTKGYVQLYTKWDRQLAKTYKGFLDKICDHKLRSMSNVQTTAN